MRMSARDALVELEDLIEIRQLRGEGEEYRNALEPFIPVWIAMMQAPAPESGEEVRGGAVGTGE